MHTRHGSGWAIKQRKYQIFKLDTLQLPLKDKFYLLYRQSLETVQSFLTRMKQLCTWLLSSSFSNMQRVTVKFYICEKWTFQNSLFFVFLFNNIIINSATHPTRLTFIKTDESGVPLLHTSIELAKCSCTICDSRRGSGSMGRQENTAGSGNIHKQSNGMGLQLRNRHFLIPSSPK